MFHSKKLSCVLAFASFVCVAAPPSEVAPADKFLADFALLKGPGAFDKFLVTDLDTSGQPSEPQPALADETKDFTVVVDATGAVVLHTFAMDARLSRESAQEIRLSDSDVEGATSDNAAKVKVNGDQLVAIYPQDFFIASTNKPVNDKKSYKKLTLTIDPATKGLKLVIEIRNLDDHTGFILDMAGHATGGK